MPDKAKHLRHLRINISGLVQGVGFRPFIFRLAKQHHQNGWICNTPAGVSLAIEGEIQAQDLLLATLNSQLPPFARLKSLEITEDALATLTDFTIVASEVDGQPSGFVLPDLAPCAECLKELSDPKSRFYRYPFTSCTYCGPRYSIMREQPYDRLRTSMAGFQHCPDCEHDYSSPDNRRFHAQTIACASCGPQLSFHAAEGTMLASQEPALRLAIQALKQGYIVALQGVGGYQLLVDAENPAAVQRLRDRKQRPHKPLALLVADLATAEELCVVDENAKSVLCSSVAPIVLLPRKPNTTIATAVAPKQALLGLMLPASPIHQLLAQDFGRPLVATSGNRHNEALCYQTEVAFSTLATLTDYFLIHDRPIVRPLDDSIVRMIAGQATVLRRARGYAPTLEVSENMGSMLALGGHWKSSIAISAGPQILLSQHLGDLDTDASQQLFRTTIEDLQRFYATKPSHWVHDKHPDYASTIYAQTQSVAKTPVQHHCAHVFACMAEHDLKPPLLGVAWDGSGLGDDQQIGGSEFLLIGNAGYQRLAHLRPIAQPGGDQAARQPRRSALAVLHALFGDQLPDLKCLHAFEARERQMLRQMLAKAIHCPYSSSAGRLFDVVASLLEVCQIQQYEGQAAIELEQISSDLTESYPFTVLHTKPMIIDWAPLMESLLSDLTHHSASDMAAKFHNTLARIILEIALIAQQNRVVLSGGCFQNDRLTTTTRQLLENAGFEVYCHQQIPPNDGGLAVGQLYAAYWLASSRPTTALHE